MECAPLRATGGSASLPQDLRARRGSTHAQARVGRARITASSASAGNRCGRPRRTLMYTGAPPRASVSGISVPAGPCRQISRKRSARLATRSPPTATTRSPACTPARSAGPPLASPLTTRRPSRSAVYMPSQGRGGSRRPSGPHEVVQDRLDQVDGHEHVAVDDVVADLLLQQQRADADEPALVVEQRRAAPLRMRRRGEQRRVEQIFPESGEFPLGEDRGLQRVRAPAVADDVHVVVLRHRRRGPALDRRARRSRPSGRTRPKPVAKS